MFEDFAVSAADGNYFLRPDYIKAAFLLDGATGLPKVGTLKPTLEGRTVL